MTANPQLAIDPVSGQLTCTPTASGQYAIGICVDEYRDGVLLSRVTRDFQFNVTICEPTEFVLEADAVPFASAGIEVLVPYQTAVGLPDVLTYPNGESFPMADWLDNNDILIDVDGTSMVVDAVVMEGCNDARFTIERPESESELLDTTYLTLTGTANEGLDYDQYFSQVVMLADSSSSTIELGLIDDGFEEGVEHLVIECEYVNACDQVSTTLANVVIVDPVPIEASPSALECINANGTQSLGYDNITGYGPFVYTWDGRTWNNANQDQSAWTVQFDSLFNMVDGNGQLPPATLVDLQIEDQCGKAITHTLEVLHPVAFDDELCPLEIIEFPMHNDGIPISDVLYGGVSILNTDESGMPLIAHAVEEDGAWRLTDLEALDTPVSWGESLSIVDTCGFSTESLIRVRDCQIPNVFTPDNVTGNNVFRIRGLTGMMGSRLLIYNRYGVEVWSDVTLQDDEPELVWDGRYMNGDDVPDGHYQWVLIRADGIRDHGSLHVFRSR